MTPSRVPVTSEGPALAPALAFAGEVVGTFDKWLEKNRPGEFLGAEDVVEIVRFFLDGDRPHRVAHAVARAAGEEPSQEPLALQYGPGSSYRGPKIPSADLALDSLPYADVWAERCAQEVLGSAAPMKAALAAYSESGDTPFCPLLDAREEA